MPSQPLNTNNRRISRRSSQAGLLSGYGSLNVDRMSWTSSYTRSVNFQNFRDTIPPIVNDVDDDRPDDLYDSEGPPYNTENDAVDIEIDIEDDYVPCNEGDPLLKPNGMIYKSTFAQSLFNSVNILMGVGVLSLPYAFSITGWAIGFILLILFGYMTHHTARLLQYCLDYVKEDGTRSYTYGDLGEMAFGVRGRTAISILFFMELIAASVALIILSADSIVALIPSFSLNLVKCSIVALVLPLTIPKSLSLASYGSIVGILALINLVAILIFDGLSNFEAPGSLWDPALTSITPNDWYPLPFAFGLFMAGYSGHSVFPNLYRDMQHQNQYPRLLNYTYVIIVTLYLMIASMGYFMFGAGVREEVLFFDTR